jgi:hypothetical protein
MHFVFAAREREVLVRSMSLRERGIVTLQQENSRNALEITSGIIMLGFDIVAVRWQ